MLEDPSRQNIAPRAVRATTFKENIGSRNTSFGMCTVIYMDLEGVCLRLVYFPYVFYMFYCQAKLLLRLASSRHSHLCLCLSLYLCVNLHVYWYLHCRDTDSDMDIYRDIDIDIYMDIYIHV